MTHHGPRTLERALDAARKHIKESAPFLVEQRQLAPRVATDLRVYVGTASVYVRRLIENKDLVALTFIPGEPVLLTTPQGGEAVVWVGDPRPRTKNALHYKVMDVPPKVGPRKPVTFVLTPQQYDSIAEMHADLE